MEPWQEPGPLTGGDDMHGTYVERTIRELQLRITQAQKALAELQTTAAPVALPSPAASLAVMTAAYEAAAQAEPFVPFPDSVLPALLALRTSNEVLAASQAYLGAGPAEDGAPAGGAQARKQLAAEQARREDQRALQAALEARVAALRSGLDTRSVQTPAARRQATLDTLRAQAQDRDRDTTALLHALKGFLQDQLGPMLAAEEQGGPVVGSAVDDVALKETARRRKQTTAAGSKKKKPERDSRQRRLEDMWGGREEEQEEEEEEGSDDDDNGDDNEVQEEAAAASAEMQELTEELLNALVEAGGDGGSAYVVLARESAAARFLVRSKVAQFHPRDATRLRLIDFGRDLDD